MTLAARGTASRLVGGFSHVDVLISVMLIALALVPAIDGLTGAVNGGEVHVTQVDQQLRLIDKMEFVLAQPVTDLESAAEASGGHDEVVTAYSDPLGTQARRLVYLARYDGDDADDDGDVFSGGDDGLIWVRVAIEATPAALETLVAR